MFRKNILISLLFLLLSQLVSAQTHHFRNYSVEHGLPFIQVSAIFQDSKGNLWSGAYGGLSKYDGVEFTNYGTKDGLVNHSVTTIKEDKQGNLWIGTISGLSRFDGKTFTNFSIHSGLPHNYITSLVCDSSGNVWIGTKGGLSRFSQDKFINLTTRNGLSCNTVLSLCTDQNGLWVGTQQGLNQYNGNHFKLYNLKSGLTDTVINSLMADRKGTLWIGTNNGFSSYRAGLFKNYKLLSAESEKVSSLYADISGKIWIGTGRGLFHFENNRISKYSIRPAANANIITALWQDYENNLWIGTHSGLFKYRGPLFVSYSERDGLTNSFIYQITKDKKGVMWFGSENGLQRFDGKSFTSFGVNEDLAGANVWAVLQDKDFFWLGTDQGVSKFDGKSFKNLTISDGLQSNNCLSIYKDRTGVIWFGGHGGVTRYDGKSFKAINIDTPDKEFDIASIYHDSKGNLWFGGYQGGLYKLQGSQIKEAGRELGIYASSFMSIIEDKSGRLYFGSFDGTFIYDGTKIYKINEKGGLNSDLVYVQTLNRDESELWIGTNQGLNKVDLAKLYKEGKLSIEHFAKEEGFTGVECNSNSIYHEKDGSIWFGTVNGLIKYSPQALRPNNQPPITSITGFSLFYKDTILSPKAQLPYDHNNLTFKYVGISLTNPEKVRYQYKLAGFDKEWSPLTKINYATYSNLPPGNYTFQVKAMNNEGVWNVEPVSFTFSIERPFWKTWWFWSLTIGAITLIIILAVRYRISQIRLRERENLQRSIELASNELKALRAQMNPHFIFNSLNSIQHFIMSSDEASASKYLNKFAKLIRIILNNSEKPSVSIREELEALKLYLELECLRFDNKFSYEINVEAPIDIDNYELPAMLIQPYVENAILHGLNPKNEKGTLKVDIKEENNFIICRISDNGIGRKRAGEMKGKSMKVHNSLGTKITMDRLALLNKINNSNLSVNIKDLFAADNTAAGTEVEIFIPLS